jgi:anti-sigma28 factor (negative regulator of flagellin synthesis)
MKINPIANPNILRSYQTAKMVPSKVSLPSGRDEVTFSDEALSFSKVMAEVEFRTQEEKTHIAEITNSVRNGDYKIDSDVIADKILESVLNR